MDLTSSTLFGKTRRAVLTLLFGQPDRWFYLRELARLTGISPGSLQRELGLLGQADLIERTRDGNRVTYRANRGHPVFAELRSIVQKTCGLPRLLQEALSHLADEIDFAAVYGSMAKGTDHARSDVDLLIVGSIQLGEATAAVAPVERKVDREIGLRVFTTSEFEDRLVAEDAFLGRVLSGPLTPILGELPHA